ncbi:hypothetical protein I302_105019 [Kwoniella bestiolae CBS 10118]|uniref:Uncharacterized protein n=1 Tax=Kwoniella bestiolae CBS 10118 TaxID=1296100 RepID=A0A1B9FR42_9TREE|nr:hypothetical protein I302_08907 [Kwoniella bestiolae CBS 10118]OCF21235.1 hypothetical protein I302_08907 [Kwoniella bestiolae CBS 10118]
MSFLKSPSAPRHYRSPIAPYIRSMPHLPFEVFLLLLSYDQSPTVLAKLCLLNTEIYKIVMPYLYRRVELDKSNWDRFLWGFEDKRPKEGPGSFVFKPPKELLDSIGKYSSGGAHRNGGDKDKRNSLDDVDGKKQEKKKEVVVVEPNPTTEGRKRKILGSIRILVIKDIPNITTSQTFLHIVNSTTEGVLFSGVRRLILDPQVLYSLAQWKHLSHLDDTNRYTRIHDHDFIIALNRAMPRSGKDEISISSLSLQSSDSPSTSDKLLPVDCHGYLSYAPEEEGFELEVSGSLLKLSDYHPSRTSDMINSFRIPRSKVFGYSKEMLQSSLTRDWGIRKFSWHDLTHEELPFLSNSSLRKVEYHFVKPSSRTTHNYMQGPASSNSFIQYQGGSNTGVDLLTRVVELRAILLKSKAAGLATKYRFIGTGLGVLYEEGKSEIELQEKIMGIVKNSDQGHTIGTEVIEDEWWVDHVDWSTSTSGLLSIEERQERGMEGAGSGAGGCDCYPVTKTAKTEDGSELKVASKLSERDTRRTERELGFEPYSDFIQNLSS